MRRQGDAATQLRCCGRRWKAVLPQPLQQHDSRHIHTCGPANQAPLCRAGAEAAAACRRFVEEQQVDVLTMEIEHIDVDTLDYVVLHQGVDVQPRPSTLRIIQVWACLCGLGSRVEGLGFRVLRTGGAAGSAPGSWLGVVPMHNSCEAQARSCSKV